MTRRRRGISLIRWETAGGAAWRRGFAVLLLSGCAGAQNLANWNTTSGNWNNAANWDCVVGGGTMHCVPSAGFNVINIGGDITLDVDATVALISGNGGSLTLSGKTLTATDPLGIQMTGGIVNASGSVINGFLLTNNLLLATSTVNGSVEAFTANITGSTVGPLTIDNQLTAANSNIALNSNLTIGNLSSISNSRIGGQFNITSGASLTVGNGSTVNATETAISQGSLTLQGGSTWNASGTPVFLGISGASALDVTGAGSVLNLTNAALELGQLGNSTVTVEHQGSVAASGSGGNLLIGLGAVFQTDSRMIVNSGGAASANNITVSGSAIGSTGLLSVSDSSSSVTAAGQLLVASGGVVNAANQGVLTADSLRIQSGIVTIDSDATLKLTSDTAVLVGSAGTGTLTLQGGGTASASGELVLGTSATSTGTVNITGSGSTWNGTGSVSVGYGGSGVLNVSDGGLLVTGSDANGLSGSIGTQSTGTGTVTLQGGDWQANGALQIGAAGTGTLQLLQAGTVESGPAVIGLSGGATGSATVSDPGSKWTISGDLTVGSAGVGSLNVLNGGQVSDKNGIIGELPGVGGSSVQVAGVGSQWTNAGKLTVGQSGTGSLFISGGGIVTNVDAVIGDKAGSSGTVTVTGLGSSWQNSGILSVGGDGGASLTVNAGSVIAGGAAVGSNFVPVNVDITNHGSMTILGDLSIGGAAPTTFTVENGGTLDSGDLATIGGAGGDTTVTITGTDSDWTLHGIGQLTIDDLGSLFVTDGGTVTAATLTVDTGGLLNGQGGTIIGNVVNHGGTVTPGDATGIMSITGNYTQTSGSLLFEIDGLSPPSFDQLLISGVANISGGSIDVQFGDGFLPLPGESFDLISAAGGLAASNVSFDVTGLPAGLRFTDIFGANGLELSFAAASSSAPEPGAVVLLGTGIAILLARRKSRVRT